MVSWEIVFEDVEVVARGLAPRGQRDPAQLEQERRVLALVGDHRRAGRAQDQPADGRRIRRRERRHRLAEREPAHDVAGDRPADAVAGDLQQRPERDGVGEELQLRVEHGDLTGVAVKAARRRDDRVERHERGDADHDHTRVAQCAQLVGQGAAGDHVLDGVDQPVGSLDDAHGVDVKRQVLEQLLQRPVLGWPAEVQAMQLRPAIRVVDRDERHDPGRQRLAAGRGRLGP